MRYITFLLIALFSCCSFAQIHIDTATLQSNQNPFVLPAGLVAHKNNFQIASGAIKGNGSSDGTAFALVGNPVTTGDLTVAFTISQSAAVYNDNIGAVFADSAGNGYIIYINGPEVSLYALSAFNTSGSALAFYGSAKITAGAAFRATLNISTGVINFYENATSTSTPILTYAGKYVAGMQNGFSYFWWNVGGAGFKTLDLNQFAAASSSSVASSSKASSSSVATSSAASSVSSSVAALGSLQVAWIAPTKRTDGSALAPSEIAGYNVQYRLQGAVAFTNIFVLAPALSVKIDSLKTGTYEVQLATVDINNLVSVWTNSILQSLSLAPLPPSGVTVVQVL